MITFSSCWYPLTAKFDYNIYRGWIHNMLSNVNNYFLVVYTNEEGKDFIESYLNNPNIKMIVKPIEQFCNYKYKDHWIKNHLINTLLNQRTDWCVNMLWSEKTAFVKETAEKKYFNTEFYGWCDIGYFRNRSTIDFSTDRLSVWPNHQRITQLNKDKIHYACVNNNNSVISGLMKCISNKNAHGLPAIPIPPNQISIAGGFFILHHSKANWWQEVYDNKLRLYFENGYLVKDDQSILADIVFSNMSNFALHKEVDPSLDNWFLFQRLLL